MNKINLNAKALIKDIEGELKPLFSKNRLNVGFFETAKYTDGAYVAEVAKKNEFGTLEIPSRPFFRTAVSENYRKWVDFLANDITKTQNAELSFNRLGEVARGDIIKSIDNMNTPPNSPLTIAAKGSSKPLIDTGFMRASVNFKVDK